MTHSGIKIGVWVLSRLLAVAIWSIGCSRTSSPYKALLKNDFYAYALPADILEKEGWNLRPIEKDWDSHCLGGPSVPWNPVDIVYEDQEGNATLSLVISEWDVIWDRQRSVEEIALNNPWVEEGTGLSYSGDDFSPLKFTDTFGNEVVVDGWLSIDEKVSFINQLEYIGPPLEKFIDPWSTEWCESH